MTTLYPKVTVATIMYGDRWKFLSQVVDVVMKDNHVVKMVIVDNGSQNKEEIENGTKKYGDRVIVLRQEKNLGSAGGFALALDYARSTECDFVFVLDDDLVPEDNFVESFMNVLKLFPEDKKVVLCGSRPDVLDNKEYFFKQSLLNDSPRGTFFEVLSFRKLKHFFDLLIFKNSKNIKRGPFIPVVPNESFVYGGAFLPIEAVRRAPLPDASLFLYGDDIEYSWNIKKLGYQSYLSSKPVLHDIDFTFGVGGSHIFGQFDKNIAPFKVYYRLRNMVRLSIKHSKQSKFVLFINILLWTIGLFILGLIKCGPTITYFKRVWLMVIAVYAGYFPNSNFVKKFNVSFPQTK